MKQTVIKKLSTIELREKIFEENSALTKMKLSHAVSPLENPLKITESRKTLARLKTEFRKREIESSKK